MYSFIKKNAGFTAVIILLVLFIQFIQNSLFLSFKELGKWLMEKESGPFIISHFKVFLLLIWFLGIIYSKRLFQSSKLYKIFFLLSLPFLMYAWNLKLRVMPLYNLAKERGDKVGKVYINDNVFGYTHAPFSTGYRQLGEGDIIIHHDAEGFRIPVNFVHSKKKPSFLVLGCSVSYGDACRAEKTFPYLLSKSMNGDYFNASVSGYGLSQMVLKAEKYINEKHPDYVIVQYSPWLADRSKTYYQNFLGGKFPIPYFSKKGLEMPVFSPKGLKMPLADFKNTPNNTWDFSKFYLKVTPILAYQDINSMITRIKSVLGIIPKPLNDNEKIEEYGYDRIYQACKRNHARMILWTSGTGFSFPTKLPPTKLITNKEIIKVYIDSLFMRLHPTGNFNAYQHFYGHWYVPKGSKDSVFADGHPNDNAHKLISDEILKNIKEREDSSE